MYSCSKGLVSVCWRARGKIKSAIYFWIREKCNFFINIWNLLNFISCIQFNAVLVEHGQPPCRRHYHVVLEDNLQYSPKLSYSSAVFCYRNSNGSYRKSHFTYTFLPLPSCCVFYQEGKDLLQNVYDHKWKISYDSCISKVWGTVCIAVWSHTKKETLAEKKYLEDWINYLDSCVTFIAFYFNF